MGLAFAIKLTCTPSRQARDKAKYMDICHWMSFVESNNLLAPHMGEQALLCARSCGSVR